MKEICETCKFYHFYQQSGHCHRNPPTGAKGQDGFSTWPEVAPEQFCGEWRERQSSEVSKPKKKGGKAHAAR
jgi:hypothetical protein